MHHSVMEFAARVLRTEHVAGKHVLEVGSYDVNGSLRPGVAVLGPATYVGTDMRRGPGVDVVVSAEQLVLTYGIGAFDVVLCAEMLEHAEQWRAVVRNLKDVLRPGGHLLLTARSVGFPLHDFPADYWRFGTADFARAFADFDVVALESDPQAPGAFLFARKPTSSTIAVDLEQLAVWSMSDGALRGSYPGAGE